VRSSVEVFNDAPVAEGAGLIVGGAATGGTFRGGEEIEVGRGITGTFEDDAGAGRTAAGATKGAPHIPQKRLPSVLLLPHLAQRTQPS
jgi:hypothetical protein